jgi:hypothetical protein
MKKFLSILVLAAALAVPAQAQSILGGLLGGNSDSKNNNNSTTSTIGSILGGLAGTVFSAPVSLNGTYSYNGVAVSATSSEGGVLSNLAGSAVTSGIETKIDEYLAKVGIKPGAMTITFNSSDNTFTWTVAGIPLSGKYKVGDGEKTVTLTFGKTMQYFSMTGTLESSLSGARMLFTSQKAVAFLKKVASKLGQSNSQIGSIAKLADGYDNFRIGFKLSK